MLEDNSSYDVDLCRLCSFIDTELRPIFDSVELPTNGLSIVDKISICLPVKIKKEDQISKKICTRCVTKVEEFYEFWNNAAVTQEILENLARKSEREINEEKDSALQLILDVPDCAPEPDVNIKEEDESDVDAVQVKEEELNSSRNSLEVAVQTEPLILIIKKKSNLEDLLQIQPALTPISKSSHNAVNNYQLIPLNNPGLSPINDLQLPASKHSPGITPINSLESIAISNAGLGSINNKQSTSTTSSGVGSINNLPAIPISYAGLSQTNNSPLIQLSTPGLIPIKNGQTTSIYDTQTTGITNPRVTQIKLQSTDVNIPPPLTPINNRHSTAIIKPQLAAINTTPAPRLAQVNDLKQSPIDIPPLTPIINHRPSPANSLQPVAINNSLSPSHDDAERLPITIKDLLCRPREVTEQVEQEETKVCTRDCKPNSHLEAHLRRHSGVRPFKCHIPKCNKAFYTIRSLHLHNLYYHTGESSSNICLYCRKTFKTEAQLKIHTHQTHTNRKTTHNAVFFNKGSQEVYKPITRPYRRHKVHELKGGPVICLYCNRTFATKSSVSVHIQTVHFGEKFRCNYCGVSVSSKRYLITHVRKHTGEKPFNCPICEKGFISKATLKQHYFLHTKERSYTCHICRKNYSRKSVLDIHLKKIHPDSFIDDISKFCEVKMEDFSDVNVKKEILVNEGIKLDISLKNDEEGKNYF